MSLLLTCLEWEGDWTCIVDLETLVGNIVELAIGGVGPGQAGCIEVVGRVVGEGHLRIVDRQ